MVAIFETTISVRRWKDGKPQPFFESFDLIREATDAAERMAAAGGVPIVHVPWNVHIEDVSRPDNCVVVEEIMRRNPRGGDGARVYSTDTERIPGATGRRLARSFRAQAAISSMRVCLSGMWRSRHWDERTPSSDSAISSQLPCFVEPFDEALLR